MKYMEFTCCIYFPDQTPTPTKFLKYGEEIGLFHELTKSPFDEAFRKAITTDVRIEQPLL